MEKLFATGEIERLTKKETLLIQREITRLNVRLSGVRKMTRLPDMIFVVDVEREYAAVHEANLLDIPVVAMVDTNCDPSRVDYVIPSNDDAIRAIKLLVAKMADAVLEGQAMRKDVETEMVAEVRPVEAMSEVATISAHAMDIDDELGDDILLGESTLAKLTPVQKTEEAVEDVKVEAEVEEKEEDK
jgi:small subunit ribosomal protein S2